MNRQLLWSFPRRARQRGAVLIVALLVLVATILAAIALVRSVDVATLISGNLAFRQAGMQATDSGVEVARTFLMTTPVENLENNISPAYFATWDGGVTTSIKVFDPKTFDWAASSKPLVTDPLTGNTVNYVVHRMCQNFGPPGGIETNCFTARAAAAEGISNLIKEPGDFRCNFPDPDDPSKIINKCAGENPFYRITVRVTGPRGTVTYAQAAIY